MYSYLSIAIISWLAYWIVTTIAGLQHNIALAKASGLPYHVSVVAGMPDWPFIATERLWRFLLTRIPILRDSKHPVLASTYRTWSWRQRAFGTLGENYLVVTASQLYFNSSEPEGILQLTNQRIKFPKPTQLYRIVDIFGRSMISSEGEEWRRHRKVIGPAFVERSNLLVWQESLRQANGMVRTWSRLAGNTPEKMVVQDASVQCAYLALNVLSGAGFGVMQVWKGDSEEELGDNIVPGFNSTKLSKGHTLSFKDALDELVHGILWMMLVPKWMLARSPFDAHKRVHTAHAECTAYFDELADYKIDLMKRGNAVNDLTMDLMAPMIKATQVSPEDPNAHYLTRKEVIADSWLLLFAGHETTANTLHYTLVYLATNLVTQNEVHSEVDTILGERSQNSWTYEKDMGLLYNSLLGACFSETLRLIPPVLMIPKWTASSAQTVTLKGTQHVLPAETMIHADACGVMRNPKYWPHSPSKITGSIHDMNDFVPQRWFTHGNSKLATRNDTKTTDAQEEDIDGLEKASFESTLHSKMYVPPKGTYLPFADGPRACPGRRFAQVELTAVLSSLLKMYTFELDVSKHASDEEVERMGKEERKELYQKAAREALQEIDDSVSIIAVRLVKPIPLRIVRRGEERFMGCFV